MYMYKLSKDWSYNIKYYNVTVVIAKLLIQGLSITWPILANSYIRVCCSAHINQWLNWFLYKLGIFSA